LASDNPAVDCFVSLPSCPTLRRELGLYCLEFEAVHLFLLYRKESELKHIVSQFSPDAEKSL
jgi:hypothetical protein